MRLPSAISAFHVGVSLLFLLSATASKGQDGGVAAGRSQITSQITDALRVKLPGNVHPAAKSMQDRGPAPETLPAERLMLVLKRSPEQDSELDTYLKSVQDPNSPQFRAFLTPQEFGRRFGISDADLNKLEGWLASSGFQVAGVNKGRSAIEFSGSVGQIQTAFHVSIHRFDVAGTSHLANISDPQIPAALARVVGGISSLNDFKPKANLIIGPAGKWDTGSKRFRPDLTASVNGHNDLFIGPGDAATIYNTPNAQNTRLAAGQTQYDGTGVTIGIVGTTLLYNSGDFAYRSFFGVNSGTLNTIYDGNLSDFDFAADETEANADTEIAGGLAPGATVRYYGAPDTIFQSGLMLAIYRAIDDNLVDILSASYGACEQALGTAGNLQVLNAWEQAAAQGIAVTVSSGDQGSAGCDYRSPETAASQGLAVNGLASTPYNIAVGGTDFDTLRNNFSTYVAVKNSTAYESAKSYISENPWNDSTLTNGPLSQNTAATDSSGQTNILAAGGGMSSAGNGGLAYAKPPWQQGFTPSASDNVRDLPDVALFSGIGNYGAVWALCSSSDCNGPAPTIHGVGGTSTSAPAFAGILALLNQKLGAGSRLGQANWVLYRLAQTTPGVFHQVMTGNIAVLCSAGSAGCGTNGFMTGYNAGTGYSLAAGLGSVDATSLVNHWSDDTLTTTNTTLTLDKTAFVHGTLVNITSAVTPASATGDIAIQDNYSAQAQATTSSIPSLLRLNAGAASGTNSLFPGGTYSVYARYSGDGSYSGSVSPSVGVTVSPEASILQLTVRAVDATGKLINGAGASFPLGTFFILDAQPIGVSQAGSPNPMADATGSVVLSDVTTNTSSPGNAAVTLDASGVSELQTSSFQAGSHAIGAAYAGDLSYLPSSAAAISFSVAKGPTTLSLTSSANSTIGSAIAIVALIATNVPTNSYSGYGTVTLTDMTNGAAVGTGYVEGAQCAVASPLECLQAFISVNSSQLSAGANSIVATYSGDNNFLASSSSTPVSLTCLAACFNPSGQTLGLAFYSSTGVITSTSGGTISTPVLVNSSTGFTGGVNLTCSVAGQHSADLRVPSCSFTPAQLNVTINQAATTTLIITSPGTTTTGDLQQIPRDPGEWPLGIVTLAGVLVAILPRRSSQSRWLRLGCAFIFSVGLLAGCAGGAKPSSLPPTIGGSGGATAVGPTPDLYTVTFRAVDSATGNVTAQNYSSFRVN